MKAIGAFLVFFIVLTLPFLVSAANGDMLQASFAPDIELPAQGGSCVEDTAFMRANHMNVLRDEREKAVHTGVRNKEHSLNNCFECHTNKEKFCDQCHSFAGIKPGCFTNSGGCHNPGPSTE